MLLLLALACGGGDGQSALDALGPTLAPAPSAVARHPDDALTWARPRSAGDQLAAVVAADPADHTAWLALVGLSAREASAPHLGPMKAAAVRDAVASINPNHPGLPAATAWLALQRGDLDAAAAALPDPPRTADEAWAALRVAQARGEGVAAAAAAALERAPAHPEACVVAARAALAGADLRRAEEIAAGCEAAGVTRPELPRVRGEVAWALGQPAAAAQAWSRAGLPAHVAEARAQGGDAAWLEAAEEAVAPALGPDPAPPPIAIHAVWFGVRAGRPDWVAAGAGRLAALADPPPSARIALAAAQLHQGDPTAAVATLEGLDGAAAEVLRGRALAALGADVEARAALARATAVAPGAPWAWRARAAVEPSALDDRDPWAARWAVPVPALDRPGDLLAPGPSLALPPLPDDPRGRAWAARADSAPPAHTWGDDVPGRVLRAWASPEAEADRIFEALVKEHPGVAGLMRERYAVRVRRPTGRAPPP